MSKVDDIIKFVAAGWRPYKAEVANTVYEDLDCKKSKKAYWFNKGDLFVCIGCNKGCSLTRPKGFPPPLPVNWNPTKVAYLISPQEMLARKKVLNVAEIAYCLNISERMVYNMIDDGRLPVLKDRPLRVKIDDVIKRLELME